MAKQPAFQFYVRDWLGDANLQAATANTRGAWINLLAHMWGAEERGKLSGSLDEMRRLANVDNSEWDAILEELKRLKIGTVTFGNSKVTGSNKKVTAISRKVTLINRRMYREYKALEKGKLRKRRYDKEHKSNGEVRKSNTKVTSLPSSSDSSSDSMNQSPPTPPLILTAFIEKFHKHPKEEEIEKLINGNEDFHGFETYGRLLFAIQSIKKPKEIKNPIGWLIGFCKKPHDYLTVKQHDDYKRTR